jgi:hypothetical protein
MQTDETPEIAEAPEAPAAAPADELQVIFTYNTAWQSCAPVIVKHARCVG